MTAIVFLPLTLLFTDRTAGATLNKNSDSYTASDATLLASPIAPPTRPHFTSEPHGPYKGTPATTGAVSASTILASTISPLPVQPTATTYPSDGFLHDPQPAPYLPAGGIGINDTPVYNAKSDFDYESLALALYQEWIELDLFQNGLATFSVSDFNKAGLTAEDRALIEFMALQELGHATMISNILGPSAPQQCFYNYPFKTVREFIDFSQKLTRFGESGVYGFIPHLDSREAAQLLLQSISTEARQQMIFRQFDGLFPMPVWFEVGVPQSWAWTLLAPYIAYCPQNQTRLAWQNFPALLILTQPNPARINGSAGYNETISPGTNTLNSTDVPPAEACFNSTTVGTNCSPAITHNRTIPLSAPGMKVELMWEVPGKVVGPNLSYITSTQAKAPAHVAWVTQLNITYSILKVINSSYGTTIQPDLETYQGDPAINGTIFLAVTDTDLFVTPFNVSLLNPHVVAGPALYQAG